MNGERMSALEGDPRTWAESELSPVEARNWGAYSTPSAATRFMARWVLQAAPRRVLEPSMGSGEFLIALRERQAAAAPIPEVWGIELNPTAFRSVLRRGLIGAEQAIPADFLRVKPFPVEAVIGNPPYVRLRHIPDTQASLARRIASETLGEPMDPSGSLWMPFVLHATRFLSAGGRLALVLPYEMTHVRYGLPLWRYLGRHFGSLNVLRVHERVFPGILQDVVILLASRFGERATHVLFETFRTASDLDTGARWSQATIRSADILKGHRPFIAALLPKTLPMLLDGAVSAATVPIQDLATFNIGYVAGDKHFFHPTPADVKRFRLPPASLVPTLTSGRRVARSGLWTSTIGPGDRGMLFLPVQRGSALTQGETRYVRHGRLLGIHHRYKCQVRDPWYVVPGVRRPDLIAPVFAHAPLLFVNDAALAVSNSFLAGHVHGTAPAMVAGAWYTSLTPLQAELNVHALGGGVLVLVPREMSRIRVAHPRFSTTDHLTRTHQLLVGGDVEAAYRSGDRPILQDAMGLTKGDVDVIEEGVEALRFWRVARGRPRLGLDEDVPEDEPGIEFRHHPVQEGAER